jgi:hypothetical protein
MRPLPGLFIRQLAAEAEPGRRATSQ